MIYRDQTHRDLYKKWTDQTHTAGDPEYSAMFYLLAMDEVTRKHINDIFDFEEHSIRPRGLMSAGWITGSSRDTVRLAFNLFNYGICSDRDESGEDIPETADHYTPGYIFACSYAPYYIQALKIRFPEYCRAGLYLSDTDD